MSFAEKLAALAQRAPSLVDHLNTEEATKNALVMPFIAALGYDVFNPQEVIPEFTADVGIKKGEKVDYAIKHGGDIAILVECKTAGGDLSRANMSQLFGYFTVTKARIAVLTNGVHYQLYSDLESPNRMDARPFLELDLLDVRDDQVAEVQKLSKEHFDLERMLDAAGELKHLRELKRVIEEQFGEPDPDLVRFLFKKVCVDQSFTSNARGQFTVLVKRAMHHFIRERVSGRLRHALAQEDAATGRRADGPEDAVPDAVGPTIADHGIETTEEEIEGYHVVKAIASQVVAPGRIAHRDTKSYMGVLLDDNNRKPICRLRFNWSQKYIGLFDDDRNEIREEIGSPDDIYRFADRIKATAAGYDT